MIIGIDARSLEEPRTGVARYLTNLLENWACLPVGMGCSTRHRFVLYFKDRVPDIGILEKPCYTKKVLKFSLGAKSNALFQHYLLPKEARRDKIDVLFSPAYILPLSYKDKAVVAIHDISYEIFPENLPFADKILLRKFSKTSALNASAIITVSKFSKKEISSHYGIPEDKIFVTLLGADRKFLGAKQSKRVETIKTKFGIKDKFILSVGTIFNRRHTDSLIKAFCTIAEKFTTHQLLVIGKNHTNPSINIDGLIKKVNNKLGRKAILMLDSVEDDDLVALFATSETLVYLSDYEGFGLPPLEAALAGTPVITSSIPAIRETMGDAAIFVKNNTDTEEIKSKIERMITDGNLRSQLSQQGIERAKLFDWSACAKQTLEILEKVGSSGR